jgi:hypothetical protein
MRVLNLLYTVGSIIELVSVHTPTPYASAFLKQLLQFNVLYQGIIIAFIIFPCTFSKHPRPTKPEQTPNANLRDPQPQQLQCKQASDIPIFSQSIRVLGELAQESTLISGA